MLEFNEGPFTRPLAIIYKRGRELSPAVRKFIEVLTTSKVKVPGGHPVRNPDKPDKGEKPEKNDKGDRGETTERAEKIEKSA
jgi:hypothetical protein